MEENTIISEEINTTEENTSNEAVTNAKGEEENYDTSKGADDTAPDTVTEDECDKIAERQAESKVDYHEVARRDIEALKGEFPELSGLKDITELENPMRYAALRDMGLEPREAYLATTKRVRKTDTRSHLISAAPKSAHSPAHSMYGEELSDARALFSDMTDSEIQNLYRKVTK